jgi:hypothetical protein
MLTLQQATDRLKFMTASTSEPTLDADAITELLAQAKRFNFWTTATGVAVGDVIQPTTANGHRYVCTEAGTTGATEPTWPTSRDGLIGDGTATFQEVGPAFPEQWDLRRAAHLGWLRKAAQIAGDYNFSVDGQSFSRSQAVTHCMEMASRFAPLTVA